MATTRIRMEGNERGLTASLTRAERSVRRFSQQTNRQLRGIQRSFNQANATARAGVGRLNAAFALVGGGLSLGFIQSIGDANQQLVNLSGTAGDTVEEMNALRLAFTGNGLQLTNLQRLVGRLNEVFVDLNSDNSRFQATLADYPNVLRVLSDEAASTTDRLAALRAEPDALNRLFTELGPRLQGAFADVEAIRQQTQLFRQLSEEVIGFDSRVAAATTNLSTFRGQLTELARDAVAVQITDRLLPELFNEDGSIREEAEVYRRAAQSITAVAEQVTSFFRGLGLIVAAIGQLDSSGIIIGLANSRRILQGFANVIQVISVESLARIAMLSATPLEAASSLTPAANRILSGLATVLTAINGILTALARWARRFVNIFLILPSIIQAIGLLDETIRDFDGATVLTTITSSLARVITAFFTDLVAFLTYIPSLLVSGVTGIASSVSAIFSGEDVSQAFIDAFAEAQEAQRDQLRDASQRLQDIVGDFFAFGNEASADAGRSLASRTILGSFLGIVDDRLNEASETAEGAGESLGGLNESLISTGATADDVAEVLDDTADSIGQTVFRIRTLTERIGNLQFGDGNDLGLGVFGGIGEYVENDLAPAFDNLPGAFNGAIEAVGSMSTQLGGLTLREQALLAVRVRQSQQLAQQGIDDDFNRQAEELRRQTQQAATLQSQIQLSEALNQRGLAELEASRIGLEAFGGAGDFRFDTASTFRPDTARENIRETAEEVDDFTREMRNTFSTAFQNIIIGTDNSLDDVGRTLLEGFRRSLFQALDDDLFNPIADAFSNFLRNIFNSAIQGLGNIGIPGFQSGGFTRGGLAIVGEAGPELVNFGRNNARIFNAQDTAGILGGRGNQYVVNLQNNDSVTREIVRQELQAVAPLFNEAATQNVITRLSAATTTRNRVFGR